MRQGFDRKYFRICLYAFITIAALLLFQRMLQSSADIWKSMLNVVSFVLQLLSPFIISIFIAYLLSPAVRGINLLLSKVFPKEKHVKARKLASLITVYALIVALIALTLAYVIPGIVRNIGELIRNLPQYYSKLTDFYNNTILTNPLFANETVQKALQAQLVSLDANVSSYLSTVVSSITAFVVRFFSSIAIAVLGLVMSFYVLNESENIVGSSSRLLAARLGEKRANSIINFFRDVDCVFGKYISAKLLVMLILFAMSVLAFSLLNVRYMLLMSALIAVTSFIPILGPYLGGLAPVLISLLESPQKAIYVLVAVAVIHTIDGYFIEPYIFSDQMGLSPFWILLSIIVGGGLFGLWGILLAVPLASVLKIMISRYIRARNEHRQRQQEEKNVQS